MHKFDSVLEAKNYLVARIASEADREGQPLTEVERKMMYFTETEATIPEMGQISEAFDRDDNQPQYEAHIGKFICQARAHLHDEELNSWNCAIRILEQGDHYLLVLLRAAPTTRKSLVLDAAKLFAAALLGIVILGLLVFLTQR